MKYYNGFFATFFTFYNRFYETDKSRISTIMLAGIHVTGFFIFLEILLSKIFSIDRFKGSTMTFMDIYLVVVIIVVYGIALRYYSLNRVEGIVEDFKAKSQIEQIFWGFFSAATLILEYVAIALLLTK